MNSTFLRNAFLICSILIIQFQIANAETLRLGKSLNPGVTKAILQIIRSPDEFIQQPGKKYPWDKSKIYVLPSTPPEIGPIAGVISAQPGSAISHVQLLCAALGVPNSSISEEEFKKLEQFDGQEVFYASMKNEKILIKLAAEMNPADQSLIDEYNGERKTESITLKPVNLDKKALIDLKDIRTKDSGILAGPKGSFLGEMKYLFASENRVTDGFIIPFGFVNDEFIKNGVKDEILKLSQLNNPNPAQDEIEVKAQLKVIRDKIVAISFNPEMEKEILARSKILLDQNNGNGLFIRSDTNVEDMPEFTGAGLNKTIPNVVDVNKVISAVKTVWASPWSERAYKWKKSAKITNLQDALPSVVVMQSIPAIKSGVIITKNVNTDNRNEIFVSMSYGIGVSVVDGDVSPQQNLLNKTYLAEDGTQHLILDKKDITHVKTSNESDMDLNITTFKRVLNNQDASLEEILQGRGLSKIALSAQEKSAKGKDLLYFSEYYKDPTRFVYDEHSTEYYYRNQDLAFQFIRLYNTLESHLKKTYPEYNGIVGAWDSEFAVTADPDRPGFEKLWLLQCRPYVEFGNYKTQQLLRDYFLKMNEPQK